MVFETSFDIRMGSTSILQSFIPIDSQKNIVLLASQQWPLKSLLIAQISVSQSLCRIFLGALYTMVLNGQLDKWPLLAIIQYIHNGSGDVMDHL